MHEHLRDQPREGEERDPAAERRADVEQASEADRRRELAGAERERDPAGLVGEETVVDGNVEGESEARHQAGQLERPPLA